MRLHSERVWQVSNSQDHNQLIGALDDIRLNQRLRRDLGPLLKDAEPLKVDRREMDTPRVPETNASHEGELAHKGQLTTLEIRRHAATTASILSFRAAPSRLALPGSDASPLALPGPYCPLSRSQIV